MNHISFNVDIKKDNIYRDIEYNLYTEIRLKKYIPNYNNKLYYYINNITANYGEYTNLKLYILNDEILQYNLEKNPTFCIEYNETTTKLKITVPEFTDYNNIIIDCYYNIFRNKLEVIFDNGFICHKPALDVDMELEKLNIYNTDLVNPDTKTVYNLTLEKQKENNNYNAISYYIEKTFNKKYNIEQYYQNFIQNIEVKTNNITPKPIVYINHNLYTNTNKPINISEVTIPIIVTDYTDQCILLSDTDDEITIKYRAITLNDDSYLDFKSKMFTSRFRYITNKQNMFFY